MSNASFEFDLIYEPRPITGRPHMPQRIQKKEDGA